MSRWRRRGGWSRIGLRPDSRSRKRSCLPGSPRSDGSRIGTMRVWPGDCAIGGSSASSHRAERALRPAVLVRKTGGCNKTRRGARTHAVLASLLQTLRQPGRETPTYRISVLTAPARLPPLFPPPVWDTS
jgi:hypothetical protein